MTCIQQKKFVLIFTYHLLPLATGTGKDYPRISKIEQQNPVIALEDLISAYFKYDFQTSHAKIYQKKNFSALQLKDVQAQGCLNLKLVSAIFYQIFIFSSSDRPSKTMKNVFYFISKAPSVLEIFKL